MNLLFITDTPCKDTGFGRIAKNLLPSFQNKFDNIYVWGLGHQPINHDFNFLIMSANPNNSNWRSEENIKNLKNFIEVLPNNLIILLQGDPFRLNSLIPILKEIKLTKNIFIITYAAIDSFLIKEDIEWLNFSDKIIVYSEYGKNIIEKTIENKNISIIPPGIESNFYKKEVDRQKFFPSIKEEDFLILYVNSNNPKKSPQTTIDIFQRLLFFTKSNNIKLYLHTPPIHPFYHLNLRDYAKNIGIPLGSIFFADSFFDNLTSLCDTQTLNEIYNCANLFISTTGSEGFGFTPCEAVKTRTPVAIPFHTSLQYLFDRESALLLPCSGYFFDEYGRIHNKVDIELSSRIIYTALEKNILNNFVDNAFDKISKYTWTYSLELWNYVFNHINESFLKKN